MSFLEHYLDLLISLLPGLDYLYVVVMVIFTIYMIAFVPNYFRRG